MRCLHHVFLRGAVALLLLACVGMGWSLLPPTCDVTSQAGALDTATHRHC
jgi:hypothetical protein